MKIERATLSVVAMSLHTPFKASTHGADALRHILVKLEGDGITAWGECAAPTEPYYMGETTETCWHIMKDFLAPAVVGKEWSTPEEFARLYQRTKGNGFAKSGLEMAAWDFAARANGRSLAAELGGTRPEILSGVSLGIQRDLGKLVATIQKYVDQGYRRVKMKIAPGFDVEPVRAVRERFPDLPIMADANSAYTLADAAHLRQLDAFGLMMIEQPLEWDDMVNHAALQTMIETPICLDESVRTVADARRMVDTGAGKVINIKAPRVGGFGEAKRIAELAAANGIGVWCGGMHEFGIGRAGAVALCSLAAFDLPGDISGSDKYFDEDIVEPAILAEKGAIRVPTGRVGLGWEPVEARIAARTLCTEVITA